MKIKTRRITIEYEEPNSDCTNKIIIINPEFELKINNNIQQDNYQSLPLIGKQFISGIIGESSDFSISHKSGRRKCETCRQLKHNKKEMIKYKKKT